MSRVFGDPSTMYALNPMVHHMTSAAAILTRPLSQNKKKQLNKQGAETNQRDSTEHAKDDSYDWSKHLSSLEDLSLTIEDMRDNNYPLPTKCLIPSERKSVKSTSKKGIIPSNGKPSILHGFRSPDPVCTVGFVQTKMFDNNSDETFYRVLALDCEMCMTKMGLELTR